MGYLDNSSKPLAPTAGFWVNTSTDTGTGTNTGTITQGPPTVLATSAIGTTGGTITVDNAILKGLTLTVPPGSYPAPTTFKISSTPVVNHSFGAMFTPITPLITVENGGGYSDEIMTIKIPVNIPAGYFAMGFFYNADKKNPRGHANDSPYAPT
jgi:hypothetical protein